MFSVILIDIRHIPDEYSELYTKLIDVLKYIKKCYQMLLKL